MEGKPIVIFNRPMPGGGGFWDSLVDLLHAHGRGDSCIVVDRVEDIIPALYPRREPVPA